MFGAGADSFLFVSDNDFIVGNFDDFAARDGELGIHERFEGRAPNDELLDGVVFRSNSVVDDVAEFGAFFGFDFESEEVEVEVEDLLKSNNVVTAN